MINELFYKHLTAKNVIFLISFILLTIFALKNVDLTLMFFVSIVIACSLNPLVDKLAFKINRHGAAAIVLTGFILLLLVFLLPILYIGVYEINACLQSLSNSLNNIDQLSKLNQMLMSFGIDKANIPIADLAGNATYVVASAFVFLKNAGSFMIYLLITVIFTFFFMADREIIKDTFLKLFPAKARKKTEDVVDIICQKIGGYVVAQSYAILSVGVVMTLGLILFRVPYAILFGLITAVLDIIPVAGPAFALVICVIAAHQYGILAIVGVVISFIAAQVIENNLVRPYAFSKLLNIHPIMVFTFLYIGAKYFGVIGALFAPAFAAASCVLIEELYMKNIE